MTSKEMIKVYEKINEELEKRIVDLREENLKLKKSIEILKPAITLGCGWYQYYITFMESISCDITEQEYELLKEVLGK